MRKSRFTETQTFGEHEKRVIHRGHCELFRAFCDLERRLYRYILSLGLRHSGPHRVLRDCGGERLHGSFGKLKLRPSAAAHAPQWEVARRQSAPSPQAQY